MKIGLIIRDLRKERKLTQEQLAIKMGAVKSTISNFENGSAPPNEERIKQLAEIFGVPVEYFSEQVQNRDSKSSQTNEEIESLKLQIAELKKDKITLQADKEFYKQIIQSKMFQEAPGNLNFPMGSDKDGRVIAMYPEVATQTAVK